VTIGLFLHEHRATQECGELIKVGRSLEEKMGLTEGHFVQMDRYYHNQESRLKYRFNNFKGPVGAMWMIYMSVAFGWLCVAVLGLTKIHGFAKICG
jgi:hypothetical protein